MIWLARRVTALAATLFAAVASAQDVQVEKYTLPNGLTVILHEDHSRPIATINTWFRVGAKDEPARRSGFAHLFEHLMFMGTARVPGNQFDVLMESGGGSNNASTSSDRTNYFSMGPSSLLPLLLWLDADRLDALGANMTQEKVDLQRDVVRNERRQTVENTPYGIAELILPDALYPPGHPYHHPVIGSHEDLQAASLQDVKDFFATYYVPGNASLVVAGDFDPKVIKPLIADLFGSLPRRPEPLRKPAIPVKLDGVKRGTMYDNVQLPMLTFAYHSPAFYAEGDAESDLVASILTEGTSSRLYRRLVAQDKLATSVAASRDQGKLGSLFRIDVIASPGADLDRIEGIVDEEIARLCADGPTRAELEQFKARMELSKLEAVEDLHSRADKLNEYEFYLGNPNSFQRDLDRYRSATTDDVRRWAKLVLTPNARVLFRVLPLAPERAPTARDTRPTDSKPGPFVPPAPKVFTLSNGMSVMCWEMPGPAIESLAVVFVPGGALNAPDGSDAGLASLTATMIGEGAGDLDAFAFAQAVGSAGASFSSHDTRESLVVEMTVISRNIDRAASLLADAVRRPRLATDDFDRVKKLALEDLQQSEDEPRRVADRVAAAALYGAGSPLAWPTEGTPASIARITLGGVQKMYLRLVRPSHATILAAGSLSAGEVQSVLEKAFGDWRIEGAAAPFAAVNPAERRPFRVMFVDRPGAVQTMVRFLSPAPDYASKERVPLELINTLVGGSFTSRLNQNLREKHGYTYGARSSFDFSRTVGSYTAGAGVTSKVTGPALSEFIGEFARLAKGDIGEAEATKARKFFREHLVDRFAGTSNVVSTAAGLIQNGAKFESLGADLSLAESVRVGDLNAVADRFAWTGKGVLVLVGDKQTILEQTKNLGLPPLEEVDSFGAPISADPGAAAVEK